ncbi:MAG: DMT family transporter, partial [Bacteroidota bacterium]
MEKNRRIEAWFLLIILSIVWGSSFILIKRSIESPYGLEVFSPLQVGFGRIFIAGLVLFPIFLKAIKKANRKEIFWSLVVGVVGNSIPAFLFSRAEQEISSALAGMLNGTTPFFAILIAALFFGKSHQKHKWLGIAIGFVGAAGLSLSNGSGQFEFNRYVFLILIATFCYGISVNIISEKLNNIPPMHIAALSLFLAGAPQGIMLFCTDFTQIISENPHGLASLGYLSILAIMGTALALIYFN